jgi:AraC-like DNA-binding protein
MMLLIRNMESNRCRTVVMEELNKLGLLFDSVELGEVELSNIPSVEKLSLIAVALQRSGLELMGDNKILLINKIKKAIDHFVHLNNDISRPNLSEFVGKEVHRDYHNLSKIFSESEGITLERYFIGKRIEFAKEMLLDDMALDEITGVLMYSSVAHLSNQFKKITGMTPFCFRQLIGRRPYKLNKKESIKN